MMSDASHRNPWIYSAALDCAFIIAPAFVVAAAVLAFPAAFASGGDVQPWMWLVLVVGIDVAHVYSTLYRTYFDPEESARYRVLLFVIPVAYWLVFGRRSAPA